MVDILAPEWSNAKAITPDDAEDNVSGAAYLHNAGSAGAVPILFANGSEATLYFPQGATVKGGIWKRVLANGIGAGVEIVGFF